MKYDLEGVCQDCIYLEKIRPLFEEKDKQIERLNNIIKNGINEELRKELDEILKCNQKQANRIDKAIEYIKTHKYPIMYGFSNDDLDKNDLIKILQGSDKE